jgi:anti-sigma regulatory factor (Ser/Thr protein kinase)
MACEAKLWLKGDLDHLRLAWQTAETLLESLGFDADPEQARYNVLLAIQELLTNVLRHGYRGNSKLPVEVHFWSDGETFRITMVDEGPAFDPTGVPDPEFDEAMEEGGYGIYIAKAVMDAIRYERQGKRNVLTLSKRVRSGARASRSATE